MIETLRRRVPPLYGAHVAHLTPGSISGIAPCFTCGLRPLAALLGVGELVDLMRIGATGPCARRRCG